MKKETVMHYDKYALSLSAPSHTHIYTPFLKKVLEEDSNKNINKNFWVIRL